MAENEMISIMHDSIDTNMSKLQEVVKDRGAWRAAVHGVAIVGHDSLATEQHITRYIFLLCVSLNNLLWLQMILLLLSFNLPTSFMSFPKWLRW